MITIRLVDRTGDWEILDALPVLASVVERQMNVDLKRAWAIDDVHLAPGTELASPDEWPCYFVSSLDDPNALAYHKVENGYPVLMVGRDVILNNGGTILSGSNSISAALSHEVGETLIDEFCDYWAEVLPNLRDLASDARARFVALEPYDPVQDVSYEITTDAGTATVSNFVLPEWFRAGDSRRGFDLLGVLQAPQTITAGGYVELDTGEQIFGERVSAFKRALLHTRSRRKRRRVQR